MSAQSKHTPEPWQQSHRENTRGSFSTEIYDAAGETIATLAWHQVPTERGGVTTDREANARRIVACVNACQRFDTGLLEAAAACGGIEHSPTDELLKTRQQRDDLLAALQKLMDYANDSDGCQYGTLSTSLVRDLAAEAIAKAEAQS